MRIFTLLIFLFLFSCTQTPSVSSEYMDNFIEYVETLSSDDFEGRAPGTPGGIKTKNFISEKFSEFGLEGLNGSYLSDVKLTEITLKNSSTFSISHNDKKLDIDFGADYVFWTKRQVNEVELKNQKMVFIGYGVDAPEYDWNDYEGVDLKGKVVVALINDPGFELENENIFKGKAMTYYGRWTYKFEEVAKKGATGMLIIHETAPAAYGWNVVETSNTGPQLDLYSESKNVHRAKIEGWITKETSEKIFSLIGSSYEDMKSAALKKDFKAIELEGFQISAKINNQIKYANSHNVVGIKKGKTYPDEFIMLMAHWDHLGKDSSLDGDQIYNGAVDNATGTALIMSVAERLKNEDTERSVMFLGLTAEESGLLGSAYLAENFPFDYSQIVAGMNFDGIPAIGKTKDMLVIGYGASELEDFLKKHLKKYSKVITPDLFPEKGFFYRSDHISFAKKGIPVLYADPGYDLVDGGLEKGMKYAAEYTSNLYHQVADEVYEDWNYDGIAEDIDIFYSMTKDLANSREFPNWYENNEFRSIRDNSLINKSP